MFHFDRGLKLTKADLAIDFTRRQPRAFVSHAHRDHMAPHAYALCTPATSRLYQFRLGPRQVRELPYRTPIEWGGLQLTTYPAGHCLGSAMLLADDGHTRLLYTGDFKLGPSQTAEPAELPSADILIMESTFGTPEYRLPDYTSVVAQLVDTVRDELKTGRPVIVEAYALGKAQEVTRILTDAGVAVQLHPDVAAICAVYEQCGVSCGEATPFDQHWLPGHAIVAPPRRFRARGMSNLENPIWIAATGWAVQPNFRYRSRVDHAIPLSDHADYDQLLEAAARVAPRRIYCTHGPESFVDRLCEAGFDAYPLGRSKQHRLF